jgi:two-component system NtrC family sensor kinase
MLQVDDIAVALHLAPDLPTLWADPHQLHQVVLNLVTNAHQALRDVPVPRRLTLTTRTNPAGPSVSLEVADTGPGIPPAIQARIFEPFYTTKPLGIGTGLGLPLCQGIIEGHDGTISLQSQAGQGTVFRIELPVKAVAAVGPQLPMGETPPAGSELAAAILVVDDEPAVVRALAHLRRRTGHEVDTAANGRLALEKLQTRAYDLILSDLRMPECDGPALYHALQHRHPQLCQRIIFLTGDTLGPEAQAFLEKVGTPRLTKPCRAAQVHQVVQQALQVLGSS